MTSSAVNVSGAPQIWATRLVFLFCGIAQAGWAPLVPFAKARVHANDQQFGFLLLWFGAGSIIAMPVMGALAGRFGGKQLIRIAALCCAFGLLGAAFAPTAGWLGIALAFFGASIGSLDVAMNVQALIVERDCGRNLMPSFHAFYSVGGIAGALAMSSLLWINVSTGLAATVIVALLVAILLRAQGSLLNRGNLQEKSHTGFVWPGGRILLLGILAFLTMLAEGSMLDWSALFLADRAGMQASHAGIGFAGFSIAMTISRLAGHTLIDRFGRLYVMTAGALLAAVGFLIAAQHPTAVVATLGFTLIGLGIANMVPLFLTLASESRGAMGVNVSLVTTLGYSGILTGPAVIGFVVHAHSFEVAFRGIAFLLVLTTIGTCFVVERRQSSIVDAAQR